MNITLNHHHSPQIKQTTIDQFYQMDSLLPICQTAMTIMLSNFPERSFPYFADVDFSTGKPLELDIYITDPVEGKELNHDARGKDYATNILSYPSDLPAEILTVLPSIPLGELVVCHEVVEKQAHQQGKTVTNHLHHLLVHGILHLLGFDHELGEDERLEMESFEIEILAELAISNPYEA